MTSFVGARYLVVFLAGIAVAIGGWLLFGSSDPDGEPDANKAQACKLYDDWKEKAYAFPGATLGESKRIFDEKADALRAVESDAEEAFADAARTDDGWVPAQEAFRRYMVAMISYSPLMGDDPGESEARSEAAAVIESACARL